MILAFLVMTALVLSVFISLELRSAGSYSAISRARLNTIAAARIAQGELQQHLGRDQAVTSTLSNGWLVVTSSQASAEDAARRRHPLISGACFLGESDPAPFGETTLSPAHETAFDKLPSLVVPWMRDGESGAGGFAFGIFDESQKIDVTTRESAESIALKDIQARRQLCAQQHELPRVLGVTRADAPAWSDGLRRASTWKSLEQAWKNGGADDEIFLLHPRLHAFGALGVLANTAEGGLRVNWDQRFPSELSDAQLPCSAAAWKDFFRIENASPEIASAGFAVTPTASELALRNFPILTGLRVRFGFFNTRSDGYHRTRFNVEAQVWNPSPHPMLTVDATKLGLIDMEVMPKLEVINHNTSGTIEVDMSAFPVGQFGLAKQTVSDTTANAWLDMLDGRRFGMTSPGLLAGEVYNFFMPNPVAQPQGLSRVLSATTWKMQTDITKPTKPPSGANGNNWFHATHEIELRATMPAAGVTLHIREARGTMSSGITAANYSTPVVTLKNIPFKNFSLRLTGEKYNRQTSASYEADAANIAFSLKLRSDDPKKLEEALNALDLREPVLDFSDPRVAALYEIEQDAVTGLNKTLTAEARDGFLWDAETNSHDADAAAFSEMRVVEGRLLTAPVSVGALRHLPRAGQPAGSLSTQYPEGRSDDAVWFDRAFFAGAWPDAITGGDGEKPWSRNPWLVLRDGHEAEVTQHADAAAACLVRGVFNVNCVRPEVWRVVLARALPEWQRRVTEDKATSPAQELANCFFRLPFSAAEPRTLDAEKCDLSDGALVAASTVTRAHCGGAQGFRALDDATRDKLAVEICAAIQRHHESDGPFSNLADFAKSKVLATALEKSGCNAAEFLGEKAPSLSPLKLNPGDILESLLPFASVRGDTFKMRVRGAAFSPLGELQSSADAEVTLQRVPEFCDDSQDAVTPMPELNKRNRQLGRRFHIVAWRWLDADERQVK